jgi:hypothetical protein
MFAQPDEAKYHECHAPIYLRRYFPSLHLSVWYPRCCAVIPSYFALEVVQRLLPKQRVLNVHIFSHCPDKSVLGM